MPKFCQQCGAQAADDARFCGSCGRAFPTGDEPELPKAEPRALGPEASLDLDQILWSGSPDVLLAPIAARTTKYVVTRSRVTVDQGLIGKRVDSLELFRVKDITVRKGLAQRSRGVGDVIISSTDASTPNLTLEAVARPDELASNIRKLTQEARSRANIYLREGL